MNLIPIDIRCLEQAIEDIASGTPVNTALTSAGYDKNTMLQRIRDVPTLLDRYFQARVLSSHVSIDEIVEIADTELDFARARVRIEARIKHAEKVAPRIYGPRLDVTVDERPSIRGAMALALARIGQRPIGDRDDTLTVGMPGSTAFAAQDATDMVSVADAEAEELASLMRGA